MATNAVVSEAIWSQHSPKDADVMMLKQAEAVKAIAPDTRVWVYRNLAQAYANFVQLREKIEDPAYEGWFLKFGPHNDPRRTPPCELNPRLNRWPMDLVLRATRRARLTRRARRPRKQRLAIQASRSRRPRGRGRRERRTPRRLLVMGPRPPLRKTRVAVAPRVAAEVRHLSLRHHLSPERQSCPHRRLQRMRRDNM